mmetsp:Transcript_9530/g.21887  ORF Transcript_9530/g.21887 Transcript_9530/m.21887 type:complete len:448 (-) Transcript_9530:378-1721(-)|eukprot:CAMPEP_0177725464 /NCGR_PEP_ID=MMETSP0484_2-20121128/19264_1 /TAXON_ID=354590 /ORGANISM="Rhodomonas lens, Strain RHODO" /LENGTH=447 /DNA_ID=CAMNT_0019237977 /DNA_START=177 /DNA_END=1520 /DNA_ORIENTATION=-
MADLALPSAVSILEAQIERKKASGQRFPNRTSTHGVAQSGAFGGAPSVSGPEIFRSARCAPNEQVRQSVKAHPSHINRHDPPPELTENSKSPGGKERRGFNAGMLGEASSLNLSQTVPTNVRQISKDEGNRFRMGVPQRVEPPKDLNTPARIEDGTMVTEHDESGEGENGKRPEVESLMKDAKSVSAATGVSRRQAATTKLRDQEMLAFACRRANKTRNEALAYYNMGVLHDNDKEYDKANTCYEQYLQAARSAGDTKGEQLALNSLGINLQKVQQLEAAIEIHNQHLQIADVPGKFVAHCNLGIAYSSLDEHEKSSINHRQALRYAIVMSSLVGESLACGNLGIIAQKKGDVRTAKACMERHLKLSTALKDVRAQLDACQHLGQLANDAAEYADAASYFQQARNLALEMGESKIASACKCRIGMAKGNAQYDEFLANISLKVSDDI